MEAGFENVLKSGSISDLEVQLEAANKKIAGLKDQNLRLIERLDESERMLDAANARLLQQEIDHAKEIVKLINKNVNTKISVNGVWDPPEKVF